MAPEYALWGYLTYKADVYSFGVVALEIVSGRSNNDYVPSETCVCLLDWVIHCFSCPFLFWSDIKIVNIFQNCICFWSEKWNKKKKHTHIAGLSLATIWEPYGVGR